VSAKDSGLFVNPAHGWKNYNKYIWHVKLLILYICVTLLQPPRFSWAMNGMVTFLDSPSSALLIRNIGHIYKAPLKTPYSFGYEDDWNLLGAFS